MEALFGIILAWVQEKLKDQNWPGYVNLVIAATAAAVVGVLLWVVQGETTTTALVRKIGLVFGGSQGYFLGIKALGLSNHKVFGQPEKK